MSCDKCHKKVGCRENTPIVQKKTICYYTVNWYNSTLEIPNLIGGCCSNNGGKPEYIVKYTFKQNVNYYRYVDGLPLTWIALLGGNSTPLLDPVTGLYISSDLTESLQGLKPLGEVPVIIPDYSKTDVGKGKVWPKKVFSPFVDSTAWPEYSLTDSHKVTGGLYYNLGFIVSKTPTVCEPSWGTYYAAESGPLNDQIKAIRALGGDVTVSFGGAANTPIHIVAPNTKAIFDQYKAFTEGYGLTRIDFDIEAPWIDPTYDAANKRNCDALKQLQDYYKSKGSKIDVWFTLPILPSGLVQTGLNMVQFALDAGVEIAGVNAMTMDYGDWAAPNPAGKMGMYGIQAITALKDQLNTLYQGKKTEAELWSMIGTTPMIGANDVQGEIFTISDAQQTLTFAQSKSIGMISMWSTNRDMAGKSGITQTDYQFALTFKPFSS